MSRMEKRLRTLLFVVSLSDEIMHDPEGSVRGRIVSETREMAVRRDQIYFVLS